MFSPVSTTWCKAVNNNHFTTWPGLTTELITKHLPPSIATAEGHLNKERRGLQSTKQTKSKNLRTNNNNTKVKLEEDHALLPSIKNNILEDIQEEEVHAFSPPGNFLNSESNKKEEYQAEEDLDAFPPSPVTNIKTKEVLYCLVDTKDLDVTYSDLTGRFPLQSSRGNNYHMISYHPDANGILVQPVKNRQAKTLVDNWRILNERFEKAGLQPSNWIMDNECSLELKAALTKENIKLQLVPPHVHRANAAERAIQTWKNHFKAGLATIDPEFPLLEWDRLIEQAELTLNLLRSSRSNPKLSAYAYMFGEFDYNKTPLVPPGTKIVAHTNPDVRKSWQLNGEQGWSIGPSMLHYRCIRCFFPKTRSERDTNTVTFFPKAIPFPEIKLDDFLKQAATDIISILTNPPSLTTTSLQAGDKTRNALLEIATILHRADDLPTKIQQLPASIQQQPTKDTASPRVAATPRVLQHQLPVTASPPRVILKENIPPTEKTKFNKGIQHKDDIPSQPPPKLQTNWQKRFLRPSPQRIKRKIGHERYRGLAADFLYAQHIFSPPTSPMFYAHHIFDPTGKKQTLDNLLNGSHGKSRWSPAMSNEWGRLAQGNNNEVESTDTIDFIHHNEVPLDKKVTYASFACDHRPLKDEQWRIRIVVGGDKLPYDDDSGSPAANMLETKLLFNSVISDASDGARFCSMDLKDMFLHTPMLNPEFMKVPFKYFPEDIRQRYDLYSKVCNGFIYIKIKKGMYGLKQAALLAYQTLSKILKNAGYEPLPATLGLWKHKTKPTLFSLCVDDFGVKYYNKQDLDHLREAIETHYTCKVDLEGQHFLGFTLKWNYKLGYVDLSMPGYVRDALKKLQYLIDKYPQYSPHPYFITRIGQRKEKDKLLQPKIHHLFYHQRKSNTYKG